MDDPVAVAAAHDAQESTPLLKRNNNNDHVDETPKWYWPWPAAYWATIPVIFLAGLAVGPMVAMYTPLIKQLFCERGIPDLFKDKNSDHLFLLPGDENDCDSPEYSAAIAKFYGVLNSLSAVLITLTVRYWSSLSDKIGRRKTMLIWAIGTTVAQTFPLVVYYNKGMSLYFLWVGSLIEGMVGSILCLLALVHSYASDVSSPEQRTVIFGRMMAGWYTGLGIGSAIGGVVAKKFGMITVFWFLPTIALIDVLYLLMIPESLTVAKLAGNNKSNMPNSQSQATLIDVDGSSNLERSNTLSPNIAKPTGPNSHQSWFERIIRSIVPEPLPHRLGGKYSVVVLMITCFFALLSVMGAMYQSSNYLIYRFKWTGTELSYMGAIQGLSRLVSLTVLLPLIKKLSPAGAKTNPAIAISFDLKVMIVGLWIEAVTFLIYALSPVGEGFYIGGMTGAVGSLFFPATRGVMSQSVAPELLGKTLGTLATFESFAAVIAPALYGWIYALTLRTHPSFVFSVAAFVIMMASGLAVTVAVAHRNEMKRRA
ncbi:hypothetical protein BGZ96_008969 [Linnemannia gamsii]|uniref:MFS general substrate transporter n=1 Tax=Linnemannia gamsii TaxID=64522 RepID=A0ABQ7JY54_9FUNG|nr:hypothetical protein BGZ96_008969 [Linnemannia gamsii]